VTPANLARICEQAFYATNIAGAHQSNEHQLRIARCARR
jgi:hypothetical protein